MNKMNFFDMILSKMRYSKVKKYIKKEFVVADIGCYKDAWFLRSVSKEIKKGYGFDLKAENKKEDNIEIISINLEGKNTLKYKEEFDLVIALALLEHLSEPEQFLKNISFCLKKGGIIVLTTPSPRAKPLLEFLAYKLHLISEDSIREHKTYFSKQHLINTLSKTGFSIIEFKKFQFGLNQFVAAKKNGKA